MQTKTLYETDFNLWVESQVASLQAQSWDNLDLENLIEEIEGLTRRDKRALTSFLRVALLHILQWQYQPQKRSDSWITSVLNAQSEITLILEDSPSLKNFIPEAIAKAYPLARREAAKQTRLPISTFPEHLPYTFKAVMEWDLEAPGE